MNINSLSQIIGTVSIFILFTIKFYIVIDQNRFEKLGKVAMMWVIIYVYFLFFLKLISLLKLATIDQLTIISGFSSLIPLIAISISIYLYSKMDK